VLTLDYKLDQDSLPVCIYRIVQLRSGEPYQFYSGNTIIGCIDKVDNKWQQVSGRETLDSIVESMGRFIEVNT